MRLAALLLVVVLPHLALSQQMDPLFWFYHPMASLQADNTGGDCPAECDCPPSFPIAMYCDNRGMTKMPYIPSRIKYVYLQHNQITAIPDNAFGNATNLVWVMLHENHIATVESKAFGKLVKLDRLYLGGNNLTEVPANLPRTLRELRLNRNRISKVAPNSFGGMENLTILLLNNNDIREMGGAFKDLKSLTLLDLSNNHLKKVPESLPDMLHQLYLGSNSIDAIPNNFLNHFANLQYVRFSHNQLTDQSIPPNAFNVSGLIELDLSFNKLERIPLVSSNLEHFYLQANQIKEFSLGSFCSVVGVLNFSKIKVLRLEGNEISRSDLPTDSSLCLRLASDITI